MNSKVLSKSLMGQGNHILLLNYTLFIFFLETMSLKYTRKNRLVYCFILLDLGSIFKEIGRNLNQFINLTQSGELGV
jgi:hypothetical protein